MHLRRFSEYFLTFSNSDDANKLLIVTNKIHRLIHYKFIGHRVHTERVESQQIMNEVIA